MNSLIQFLRLEQEAALTRQGNRKYKEHWSQIDYAEDRADLQLSRDIDGWIAELEAARVKVDSSGVVEIDQHGVRSVNRG